MKAKAWRPWTKFYWEDWERDAPLASCSLAAQALWMRMLCLAARNDPVGYLSFGKTPMALDQIAQLTALATASIAEPLMAELQTRRVFSTDRFGRIYYRRMVREARLYRRNTINGSKNGSINGEQVDQKPGATKKKGS